MTADEQNSSNRGETRGKMPRDTNARAQRVRRQMTDVERQEWRDLQRRVRMYEERFGVRYSRD